MTDGDDPHEILCGRILVQRHVAAIATRGRGTGGRENTVENDRSISDNGYLLKEELGVSGCCVGPTPMRFLRNFAPEAGRRLEVGVKANF